MCGIIGYAGSKTVDKVLVDGLEHLEYRGYDSAGVALHTNDGIISVKSRGRLDNLKNKLSASALATSSVGIGHTRWATHGEPSDINSHPHTAGNVTLVHNGIIENYYTLKESLICEGCEFVSDTDTEVIAHLINKFYAGDPITAIQSATSLLRGSYALAVLFSDRANSVFAVRRDSPLIIGLGEKENFIASDIPAILPYTRDYILLDQDNIAEISAEFVSVYDHEMKRVENVNILHADWDIESAEKGGYPHFMLKEIFEEPDVISRLITKNIADGPKNIFKHELPDVSNIKRLVVVACGSAYNVGVLGKYIIERYCSIPVEVQIASEFRYASPVLSSGDALIVISQSGETADTLAALRLAKGKNVPVIAIVNVVGSSIAREADSTIYLTAGPEIAVATTKAYTAQLVILHLLALRLAAENSTLSDDTITKMLDELKSIPKSMNKILSDDRLEQYRKTAAAYKSGHDVFIIGRGRDYALALEGAMKIKEISYMHCEPYAAGELKHGSISLIENGTPTIVVMLENDLADKTIANAKEVKARGGDIILICRTDANVPSGIFDHIIGLELPYDFGAHVAAIVALQLFAYYIASARGCDIDKPRNLAKSVTVE